MLGQLCIGVVLILAVYGLVGGFRTRAFRVGRGRAPLVIALSSDPVGYRATATVLSVTSGVCRAYILHFWLHR